MATNYPQSPSNFNTFACDYDNINWIDTNTWTKKKVYDKNYWLVLPNQRFNLKLGNTYPNLTVFLKTSGEQFGDAITPKNIAGITVIFKCFDENGNLIVRDTANITNQTIGQIEYPFKQLDFDKTGTFYGEFDFTITATSSTFTLPDTKQRIEIVVID